MLDCLAKYQDLSQGSHSKHTSKLCKMVSTQQSESIAVVITKPRPEPDRRFVDWNASVFLSNEAHKPEFCDEE